jgi:phosphoribosyl-AMP cyclohydrolase
MFSPTPTSSHEQTPILENSKRDLTLQLDNTLYLCCKTVQFLAVSYGGNEAIFTQQNKGQVHLCPYYHKSKKKFHTKNVTAGHTFIAPEN